MLVLPVQFSHCWQIENANSADLPRIFRANIVQTGILFKDNVDVRLRFDFEPWRASCRFKMQAISRYLALSSCGSSMSTEWSRGMQGERRSALIGRVIREAAHAVQLVSVHLRLSSRRLRLVFCRGPFLGPPAGCAVLVGASLFFYGWWNERYVWILLLSIGCNAGFAIALITGTGRQRFWILLAGLGFNLLLLGYFKYASFLAQNVSALFGMDWQVEPLPLPLGISFFTFQKIAFLVDAYVGGVVSFNLLHYCLFVTFFPQLIAGPIVRHNEIIPQFRTLAPKPRASDFAIGGSIFAIGLFKKILSCRSVGGLGEPGVLRRGVRRTHRLRRRLGRGAGLFVSALFRFLRLLGHGR